MRIFPADRKRLVDLDILTSLHTTSAENTLIRIVSVKWVRIIYFVRLGLKRDFLMLHRHLLGCVVHRAIPIVIVADGTVEHVISKNPIECFSLRGHGFLGFRGDIHSERHFGGASAHQLAIHLDHAGVTALNGAELGVVADLGKLRADSINEIDEAFVGSGFGDRTING